MQLLLIKNHSTTTQISDIDELKLIDENLSWELGLYYRGVKLPAPPTVSEDGFYYVKVHEKGTAKGTLSKPIAISEEDYNSLKEYIEAKSVPSDFVFSTTRTSEDGKAKALSRQYFNKDIKKLASYVDAKYNRNISKIVENNSSHVFRHSRAVALLNEDKVDIMKVKKFLRHDSINSTQIYLNPEEEAVNELRINNILK